MLLCTESPMRRTGSSFAAHADVVVLNDPTNLAMFQAITEAVYLPHAYRPALHHPGPARPEYVCDLGFVGTGYPSRITFFEAMDLDGLTVKLGGNWMRLAPRSAGNWTPGRRCGSTSPTTPTNAWTTPTPPTSTDPPGSA